MEVNCYSLLFADKTLREDNGKIGVIGIFNHFNSPNVPFQPLPWAIFIALDNLEVGHYVITANLVHDETQTVVWPINIELEQKEANDVQLPLPVFGVRFPHFGAYSLTVNVNGRQVGSRILEVKQVQQ